MSEAIWLSDNPIETEKDDEFNFITLAINLAELIKKSDTPLTIGIHGRWGSGKTSLMKLVHECLKNKEMILCTWFDTWAHAQEEEIWRVIMCALVDDLDPENKKNIDKHMLISTILNIASVTGTAILTGGLSLATSPKGIKKILGGIRKIKKTKSEQIMNQIKTVRTFRQEFKEAVKKSVGTQGKYVIFIDDLDRVPPEKVIEILEAIKIFMHTQNCVFVIGCDLEYLDKCSKMVHKEMEYSGKEYLKKIVQIPINVPQILDSLLERFLSKNLQHLRVDTHEKVRELVLRSVGKNPRGIKSLINQSLTIEKFSTDTANIDKLILFKLLCFQCKWPELYQGFVEAYWKLGENKFEEYEIWAHPIREKDMAEWMGLEYDDYGPPEQTTLEDEYKEYLSEIKGLKSIQVKIDSEVRGLERDEFRMFQHELRNFFLTDPQFKGPGLEKYLRLIENFNPSFMELEKQDKRLEKVSEEKTLYSAHRTE